MDKPTHSYNAHPDSAWSLYNHITLALKESHPLHFIKDHQMVHGMFIDQFGQLQSNPYLTPDDDDDEDDSPIEELDTEAVQPAANAGVVFL